MAHLEEIAKFLVHGTLDITQTYLPININEIYYYKCEHYKYRRTLPYFVVHIHTYIMLVSLCHLFAVSCPLTTSMALVYDGVQLLAETFKHVMFRAVPLNCNDASSWDKGYTLVNYMKSVS